MRRAQIFLGCLGVLALLVWWVGITLEFEYPYTLALMQVRNAISVSGVPVSQIVGTGGGDPFHGLHRHTCSYRADAFRNHKNLTLVRLDEAGTDSYYFAYCRPTHVLVPPMERTAQRFPSLVPVSQFVATIGS